MLGLQNFVLAKPRLGFDATHTYTEKLVQYFSPIFADSCWTNFKFWREQNFR